MINGQIYDFENIKILVGGEAMTLVSTVGYQQSRARSVINDITGHPAGYASGQYSGSVNLTIERSEYERLEALALAYGGIYNMPPIRLSVSYGNVGQEQITDVCDFIIQQIGGFGGSPGKSIQIAISGAMTSILKTNVGMVHYRALV